MRTLVTGGAGFIGSHLVDRLLKDGHEVVVIDDLSTGKRSNLPLGNENLTFHPTTIMSDMRDIGDIFRGVDVLYHLAALTRPRESFNDVFRYNYINVNGTLHMMGLGRNGGVKRFVLVSSATVYGKAETFPMSEDEQNLIPMSPYGRTKKEAEHYVQVFCGLHNMEWNIVRPFNVYGKRQDPKGEYGAAIPKFIAGLKNEGDLFITGDGSQFRDFIFIDDLVELLISVGQSDVHGQIFNGGSGEKYTIKEVYETIEAAMKADGQPERRPAVADPDTWADISKAKELLGWEPKHTLVDGIMKTI